MSHLSDEIRSNIVKSEIDGGIHISKILSPMSLKVTTQNREYRLHVQPGYVTMIEGHPKYCPKPTRVHINGSTWGGSMLKIGYIGRGMHLEFVHPEYGTVHTSAIREIEEIV